MKIYTIKYSKGKFLWKKMGADITPLTHEPLAGDAVNDSIINDRWRSGYRWKNKFHSKEGWGRVYLRDSEKVDIIVEFLDKYYDLERLEQMRSLSYIKKDHYIHLSEKQVRIEGDKLYLK